MAQHVYLLYTAYIVCWKKINFSLFFSVIGPETLFHVNARFYGHLSRQLVLGTQRQLLFPCISTLRVSASGIFDYFQGRTVHSSHSTAAWSTGFVLVELLRHPPRQLLSLPLHQEVVQKAQKCVRYSFTFYFMFYVQFHISKYMIKPSNTLLLFHIII